MYLKSMTHNVRALVSERVHIDSMKADLFNDGLPHDFRFLDAFNEYITCIAICPRDPSKRGSYYLCVQYAPLFQIHYKLTEIIDRIFILDIRTRDANVILG